MASGISSLASGVDVLCRDMAIRGIVMAHLSILCFSRFAASGAALAETPAEVKSKIVYNYFK